MSSQFDINSKPDSMNNDNMEEDIPSEPGNSIFNTCHVLQPFGLRRAFQNRDGFDRFLLDYGLNILPYLTVISWFIFILI